MRILIFILAVIVCPIAFLCHLIMSWAMCSAGSSCNCKPWHYIGEAFKECLEDFKSILFTKVS